MFNLFSKKPQHFFSAGEQDEIVAAIKNAEKHTSGEVRVFIESRCAFMDAIDRASEIFYYLKMNETEMRNATLVYVALKDKQLAIFGDQGIYEKAGKDFWNNAVINMLTHFDKAHYAHGIAETVKEIGDTLAAYFPYDAAVDKNELPDEIVFGK
jgi:uncharacterized membrane protein